MPCIESKVAMDLEAQSHGQKACLEESLLAPASAHFASLAVCFLSSTASDAAPALAPTVKTHLSLVVRQQKCPRLLAFPDPSLVPGYLLVLTGRMSIPPASIWTNCFDSTKISRIL